jgi:hypothetical protein
MSTADDKSSKSGLKHTKVMRNSLIDQYFSESPPKDTKASPNPSTELPTKNVSPINNNKTVSKMGGILEIDEISNSKSRKSTPNKIKSALSAMSTPKIDNTSENKEDNENDEIEDNLTIAPTIPLDMLKEGNQMSA